MKTKLATTIAASIILLGCDQGPQYINTGSGSLTDEDLNSYVDQEAKGQLTSTLAKEEVELKEVLATLQKEDPTVVDAYYGDENGTKTLHVVREDDQAVAGGGVSDTVWPLVGGMATGMLLANAMNSVGGMSNYSKSYKPYNSYSYSNDERRKRRNIVTSGYVSSLSGNIRNSIRSNPNFKTNAAKSFAGSRISSKSSGVFKSSSSARSSSYGFGG